MPAISETVYKNTLNLSYIAKRKGQWNLLLHLNKNNAGTMSLQSVNLYCRESWKVWELINRRGLRQGIPPVELYYQYENRRWSPAKFALPPKETGLATRHALQTKEIMGSELEIVHFKNTQNLWKQFLQI